MDEPEKKPPTQSKDGVKHLLAKEYNAVRALADLDDPKVIAYLADLEKALDSGKGDVPT